MRIRILLAVMAWALVSVPVLAGETGMRRRYQRIKDSTFRVMVDGRSAGTGFAVGTDLIVTNFHVVQRLSLAPDGKTQVGFAPKIQIELRDGSRVAAAPHSSVVGPKLQEAVGTDVVLLVAPGAKLRPLKLGRFADISEGDELYMAGYPFGVEQPIVTRGVLSTKWKRPSYLGEGSLRDVAWLDVSMTRGNSGGPVMALRTDPEADAVIGVANFNLNPLAKPAEELANIAAAFPGSPAIMGVDFKRFVLLVSAAVAAQSHGVGGCVDAAYVRLP